MPSALVAGCAHSRLTVTSPVLTQPLCASTRLILVESFSMTSQFSTDRVAFFNSEPLEVRRVAGPPIGEDITSSTPLPHGSPLVLFGVDPAHSSGP